MSEPKDQTVPLILPLGSESATLDLVGGKCASLARLRRAGLAVPAAFHVTTQAYRRFVDANALWPTIAEAMRDVRPDDPGSQERAARVIQDAFASQPVPDDVATASREAYRELAASSPAVAVRSSATAEDLPDMSFAGQQDTYLNVQGEAAVLDAVRRCWASLWTARAIGYRARQAILPENVALAVVVQALVPADAAGVMFTADPTTGARDRVVLSAAWGLGESVVGSFVNPDTVVVEKSTGRVLARETADKAVMTVRVPEGTREEPTPENLRNRAVLTDEQAADLARIGREIEALYGVPMDVEWAVEGSRIHVLQARPITALPEGIESSASLEWKPLRPGGRYVRGSVIELLPDPLSPLFATVGLPAWNKSMSALFAALGTRGAFPEDMLVTLNGYAYYDIAFNRAQTAQMAKLMVVLLTRIGRLFGDFHRRWRDEVHPRYVETVRRWAAVDLPSASAVTLLSGVKEIVTSAADHYLAVQSGVLPEAYVGEALFTAYYERLVRRPGDPPALTFLLGFDSEPIRAEKSLYDLARWARSRPALAERLARTPGPSLVDDLRESEGADPGGDWSELRARLHAHLAEFGHAVYDLDFARPVPADDPAPLLETLRYFLSGEAQDPYARQAAAREAREAATRRIRSRAFGPSGAIVRRLLAYAQRFAPLREDGLADVGLGWPLVRRFLGEIARRLSLAGGIARSDDVYWLRAEELQADVELLAEGRMPDDRRSLVEARRAEWERHRRVPPPAAVPLKGGATFLGVNFERWLPSRIDQAAGNVIKGVGASPGRVEGIARVILSTDEFGQMRPGEILVARITTPAWTPLFALAAGVVTDVGGPLSHSSIVAREYHVPAVLGTGVATERITSGQRVTVDGDAGTVTLGELREIEAEQDGK